MIDSRTKMLTATVSKLFRRGAEGNIRRILQKAHTADIASLIENLDTAERLSVFHLINDISKRAEVVSYLPQSLQEEILSILDTTEVQSLVSQMHTDDAADLLRHLPEETSKDILKAMVQEDSADVEELMKYPSDSAGGLMSSEVFSLPETLTVSETIQALQKDEDDLVAFYVYVVNEAQKLVGVLSLKQLLLARPSTRLKDIMSTNVIAVNVKTNQAEVVQMVEKYDFLSLPVVDDEKMLVGVITVDDVIDVIREEAEEDLLAMGRAGWTSKADFLGHVRARLPWTALAFVGGVTCFSLIYFITFFGRDEMKQNLLWLIASFVPMILTVGSTTGHQAVTMAVGALRGRVSKAMWTSRIMTEIFIGIAFGTIFGSLVLVAGVFILKLGSISYVMSLSLALQIVLTQILGVSIPLLMNRFGFDPTIASMPLFTAIADISAVTILFGLAQVFIF